MFVENRFAEIIFCENFSLIADHDKKNKKPQRLELAKILCHTVHELPVADSTKHCLKLT